ncbi:hypothetical protein V8J88_13435 [Massilia sp. W12]
MMKRLLSPVLLQALLVLAVTGASLALIVNEAGLQQHSRVLCLAPMC